MESKSCITGFCKLVVNCKMHNYGVFGTANFTTLFSILQLETDKKLAIGEWAELGCGYKLEKA